MKVIIAGSREFTNYSFVEGVCDNLFSKKQPLYIVSGKARGVDYLGECYARSHGIPIVAFPADWLKYGKRAGMVRNRDMADYSDCLIAFWDGKSKGTEGMIRIAKSNGLQVRVFLV